MLENGINDMESQMKKLQNIKVLQESNDIKGENEKTEEICEVENFGEDVEKAYIELRTKKGTSEKTARNQLEKWKTESNTILEKKGIKDPKIAEAFIRDEFLPRKSPLMKEIIEEMKRKEKEENEEVDISDNSEKIGKEKKIRTRKVSKQPEEFKKLLFSRRFNEGDEFFTRPRLNDKEKDNLYRLNPDGTEEWMGSVNKRKKIKKKINKKETEIGLSEVEMRFIQEVYIGFVDIYREEAEKYFLEKGGYERTEIKTMIEIEMNRFWREVLREEMKKDGDIPKEKLNIAIEKIKEIYKSK